MRERYSCDESKTKSRTDSDVTGPARAYLSVGVVLWPTHCWIGQEMNNGELNRRYDYDSEDMEAWLAEIIAAELLYPKKICEYC